MITSIFKKSTPINYSLMGIMMVLFYFLYQFNCANGVNLYTQMLHKALSIVLLFAFLFLSNFIVKKNALTKNSSYTILFFFLLLLFFPNVMNNNSLLLANFFIILSMRRLVSLQTLKAPKEKIFDAALWVFVASLFHFWCILFIVVVYLSIIFHVSRDYRNWLIPFVSFFAIAVIFVLYDLVFDKTALNTYLQSNAMDFQIDYFKNKYQNLAFSTYNVFILFFIVPFIFTLTNKPLNLQASYKKVIFSALIGIIIFLISTNKSNELLIFTFLPMAIIATNTIEYLQNKFQQEIILLVSIICGFFCFFSQL